MGFEISKIGTPDRIRTCGLLLRRQTLYPAELRARKKILISRDLQFRKYFSQVMNKVPFSYIQVGMEYSCLFKKLNNKNFIYIYIRAAPVKNGSR